MNGKRSNKKKGAPIGGISGTPPCQGRVTPESQPPTRHRAPASRRLLSIAQASEYLSLSTWTIREMTWRGDLPHIRCGRRILLDIYDLDEWIERGKFHHE